MRLRETGRDLARSGRAWVHAPLLPILTVLLTVAVTVTGGLRGGYLLAGFFIYLAQVGFYGTQRLWYSAVWEGRPFSLEDAVDTSVAMWGRFFRTGVAVFLPLSVVALVIAFLVVHSASDSAHRALVFAVPVFGLSLVADLALTFVAPALAFTTPETGRALGIGLAMLRRTWPACAPYALAPPITLQALAAVSPGRVGLPIAAAGAAASALFALWWKGATAAYYLRVAPSSAPMRRRSPA